MQSAYSLQEAAETMSHDDESAFLHSDDLRASWVHLRESLLEGSSVSSK